jgi:hypothetical protein
MDMNTVANEVARRVTDTAVYAMAEDRDCSAMVARADLEAEAYADITGRPVDYQNDWRQS